MGALPASPDPSDAPDVAGSIPGAGAVDVPVDSLIAVRFTKPLRVATLTPDRITLSGPEGVVPGTVAAAEEGRLVFVTPAASLRPGTTYTLTLNGPADHAGLVLPFTGVQFSTQAAGAQDSSPSASGSGQSSAPLTSSAGEDTSDPWAWTGEWRNGRPYSAWQSLSALRAAPGATALAGQVLQFNGDPLEHVTLRIGGSTTQTDSTGRFLLTLPDITGHVSLIIDGRSVTAGGGEMEIGGGGSSTMRLLRFLPRNA